MSGTKKVVCIVQARMGSSRLPGKVMMPVLNEPMISYTLRRLKKCETIDEIILATSDKPQDDELATFAESIGFLCARGSENDVLLRYVTTNRSRGGDIVIRITGDCPLIDPLIVDLTVREFQASNADYLATDSSTVMRGLVAEVFSAEALERTQEIVSKLDDPKNYKEHVTIYMYNHPDEFRIGASAKAPEGLGRNYRLCVDEIADFKLIVSIFEHFKNPYPLTKEIVEFLDLNPEISYINKDVVQKNE